MKYFISSQAWSSKRMGLTSWAGIQTIRRIDYGVVEI